MFYPQRKRRGKESFEAALDPYPSILWRAFQVNGCGSKLMGSHFRVLAAPSILVYFSWDWDVHWEYDLDFDPWPKELVEIGCIGSLFSRSCSCDPWLVLASEDPARRGFANHSDGQEHCGDQCAQGLVKGSGFLSLGLKQGPEK